MESGCAAGPRLSAGEMLARRAILYPTRNAMRAVRRPNWRTANAGAFLRTREGGRPTARTSGPMSRSPPSATDKAIRGFVHILRDLTEQQRIETLEAEGRRIHEFIAMLSHELRNPLAPLDAVSILELPQAKQTGEVPTWSTGRSAPDSPGRRPPRRQPHHDRQGPAQRVARTQHAGRMRRRLAPRTVEPYGHTLDLDWRRHLSSTATRSG